MCETALFLLLVWNMDWRHRCISRPNFLCDAGSPAIREHLRQKLAYLCLHGLSGTFWSKMAVLGHNMGKGGVTLTPKTYFWGLIPPCHFGWKMIKKCDHETAGIPTDRNTLWHRQTEFIICPMLYTIAMGQIIKRFIFGPHCKQMLKPVVLLMRRPNVLSVSLKRLSPKCLAAVQCYWMFPGTTAISDSRTHLCLPVPWQKTHLRRLSPTPRYPPWQEHRVCQQQQMSTSVTASLTTGFKMLHSSVCKFSVWAVLLVQMYGP